MRVIAGTAKGVPIKYPKGAPTRPATELVRGAIFSMLAAADADWSRVLDLFSGSGSLGIEALSRGAGFVDFVDQDRRCCAIIAENLEKARLADRAAIHCQDVSRAIERLDKEAPTPDSPAEAPSLPSLRSGISPTRPHLYPLPKGEENKEGTANGGEKKAEGTSQYGIVLMDPPYADRAIGEVITRLAGSKLIDEQTFVVINHSSRFKLEPSYGALVLKREIRHGDSVIAVYRKE